MKILASLAAVAVLAISASIAQARGHVDCRITNSCYPAVEYDFAE